MKLIAILGWVLFSCLAEAQNVVPHGEDITSASSDRIIETFYTSLSKGDVASIRDLVLFHRSEISDVSKAHVYGAVLARSTHLLGFCNLPRIADLATMREGFKAMTGLEVVEYRVLIVRYACSDNAQRLIRDRGLVPSSKLSSFEETYCDLWIRGVDGKWRVACDYYPGARVDAQTLGLRLSLDQVHATKQNENYLRQKEDLDNMMYGN